MDDDSRLRHGLRRALERVGLDVDEAATGLEAVRRLEGGDRPYGLVVTDINMPDMDGIELLGFVRKRGGLPVLAMSGGGLLPKELLLENARILGAVEVIEKPFELSFFTARVEALLGDGSGRA